MVKITATLQDQLASVQRKLAQHIPNDKGKKSPNSNKDRMYRLLMKEAYLEDQIFQLRKKNSRKNHKTELGVSVAAEESTE